ncbi:MAG: HigA family addiction module antidote protein [Deltaproteobacteria bacterium]|nr:HigA family addiction module antidote protein [Deltaproteobacteria bacterium]MBW2257710.1 HigA family addiction module antidote protein [Deltaproteobacteria bacterium]
MTNDHPGRFLERRFLEPLGLTASELARAIHVPRSRVSELLSGKRGITPDTAARLAALFRVDPQVFLKVQADWALARVDLPQITPVDTTGFLVGPEGVTRLPEPSTTRAPRMAWMSIALLERLRAKAAQTPDAGTRELVETHYSSGQRAWESKSR